METADGADLLVATSFQDVELSGSDKPLWLDLNDREGGSQISPEKRLRLLGRVDFLSCQNLADRLYYYGWFVQAGKIPKVGDCISVLDSNSEPEPALLQFINAPAKLPSLGASYGELYERAFQKSTLSDGHWLDFSEEKLNFNFVMPHDHTRKIGLACNFNCQLKLFRDEKELSVSNSILEEPSERLVWVSIPKTRAISGGTELRVCLEKLGSSDSDMLCCKKDSLYPQTGDASYNLQLLFLSDEMSPLLRGVVLAKRGLNMIKNGEWSRFSNALKRRLPEVCKRVFN